MVEVMTVMVIIGLMSSAVVLSLPKDKPIINDYAEALVRDLNGAAQSSLLTGKTAALGLSDDAYAIYAFENEQWIAQRTAEWPDGVFVSFKKDENALKLTDTIIPLAMFEPTGESSVFALTLKNHDAEITLESEGNGRVILVGEK